jgi:hydrogenase maturation protease
MTVVIGVGNPDRGDDGVGRAVARRLRDVSPPGVEVRECEGEATALLAAWEGADEVVLVDACRGVGPPGSVHVFEATEVEHLGSDRLRHASTHSFGLVAAVGLARALGRLPSRLVVYAIEGDRFREGAELSPEADRAAYEVAELLVRQFSLRLRRDGLRERAEPQAGRFGCGRPTSP